MNLEVIVSEKADNPFDLDVQEIADPMAPDAMLPANTELTCTFSSTFCCCC